MDGLTPHHARPLAPDERDAQYKETLSFHGQRATDWKRFGYMGIIIGSVGMLLGTASMVAVGIMLPLKQTTVRFVEVDSATGWVGDAIPARDAPKLFGERVMRRDLSTYIEAREGYDPVADFHQYQTVKAMSSEDVFANYNAEQKNEASAKKQLGTSGHVDVSNFSWGQPLKQGDGTTVVVVQYQKRETKEQTTLPKHDYHATIVYAYHPEALHQDETAAEINPDGLQILSFREDSP